MTKEKHIPGELEEFYASVNEGNLEQQRRFLQSLINYKIDHVDQKSKNAKRIHYFLRISILLLAGIVTVLLGWKSLNNESSLIVSNLALFISAVISFLSGLAAFWDIDNYRMRLKVMQNNLKVIRYRMAFDNAGQEEKNQKEYKEILDNLIEAVKDGYWEQKFLSNE